MNVSRSATAFSLMIDALRRNDAKALEYALMINMNGTDHQLYNQISDSLIIFATEMEKPLYDLFSQVIEGLDCITAKETYILTAKVALLDANNIEATKELINQVLNVELIYQTTSFEIDLLNKLVTSAIYIRDNGLLDEIIQKINALGAQL